jgi:hypothetical protein
MLLWGLAWLFENNFKIKKSALLGNKAAVLFILFIILYLWQIAGLLFANSLESGFERIFKRLSYLLFPLVLFTPGERIKSNVNFLLKLFATFTFFYLLYCFGNAFNHSLSIVDNKLVFNPHPVDYDYENHFLSLRLAYPMHPSYLSIYIILSLLVAFESLFDKSEAKSWKVFWSVAILIYFISVNLLSSRSAFFSMIIITPLYFILKFYKRSYKWFYVSGIFLFFLVFFIAALTNERFSNDLNKIRSNSVQSAIKEDIRYSIWNSAISLIKENPVMGVGTGDASCELKKKFRSFGYSEGYYDDLNAHNQFLEILLENGLIGLLIFLTILGYMIYIAVSDRNYIYALFILSMLIFFAFETALNRLSGITYFSLFSFLLVYLKKDRRIIA